MNPSYALLLFCCASLLAHGADHSKLKDRPATESKMPAGLTLDEIRQAASDKSEALMVEKDHDRALRDGRWQCEAGKAVWQKQRYQFNGLDKFQASLAPVKEKIEFVLESYDTPLEQILALHSYANQYGTHKDRPLFFRAALFLCNDAALPVCSRYADLYLEGVTTPPSENTKTQLVKAYVAAGQMDKAGKYGASKASDKTVAANEGLLALGLSPDFIEQQLFKHLFQASSPATKEAFLNYAKTLNPALTECDLLELGKSLSDPKTLAALQSVPTLKQALQRYFSSYPTALHEATQKDPSIANHFVPNYLQLPWEKKAAAAPEALRPKLEKIQAILSPLSLKKSETPWVAPKPLKEKAARDRINPNLTQAEIDEYLKSDKWVCDQRRPVSLKKVAAEHLGRSDKLKAYVDTQEGLAKKRLSQLLTSWKEGHLDVWDTCLGLDSIQLEFPDTKAAMAAKAANLELAPQALKAPMIAIYNDGVLTNEAMKDLASLAWDSNSKKRTLYHQWILQLPQKQFDTYKSYLQFDSTVGLAHNPCYLPSFNIKNKEWASHLAALGNKVDINAATVSDLIRNGDREYGADILRGRPKASSIPLFIELIQSEDKDVRYIAAWILEEFHDSRTIPAFTNALQHSDEEIRLIAATALKKTADETVVPALVKVFESDGSTKVRLMASAAVKELAQIPPASLIAALKDPEVEIRRLAASELKNATDKTAIGPLIDAIQDSDFHVRSSATFSLSSFPDAEATSALIEAALKSEDQNIRLTAISALKKRPGNTAPLIDALTKHKDRQVRINAADVLENLGDPLAVPHLAKVLQDEKETDVKRAAAAALTKALETDDADLQYAAISSLRNYSGEEVNRILEDSLRHRNPRVRHQAAIGLTEHGNKTNLPSLILVTQDEDPRVREQALSALDKWGDQTSVPVLIRTLFDSEPAIRERAVLQLGKHGTPEAIKALKVRLEKETDPSVRQQMKATLEKLRK